MSHSQLDRNKRFQSIAWRLLLLSAVGAVFSDVLLFRVDGLAVTVPHILLALTTGMVLWRSKRVDPRLAVILALIASAEVIHAWAAGFVTSSEWQRSFAQFLAYGMCFVALTKLNLDRETLAESAPWAMKLGMVVGGLGILQFILFRMGVPAHLPQGWSVRNLDISILSGRYVDLSPAVGLAKEPSYYALGLTTLLAYLFFLKRLRIVNNGKLYLLAVITVISGIYLSFSLTGIVISSLLLIQQLLSSRNIIGVLLVLAVFISLIWMPGSNMGLIGPIRSRFQKVVQGSDTSALIRVAASTRLLFARSSSLETSLLGTGLGMEDREKELYLSIYGLTTQAGFRRDEVEIHTIITLVRFLQGWLGLILYGVLMWLVLRPPAGRFKAFYPMMLFFLLYHFSSGIYLSPIFWATLALVTLLRRAAWTDAPERSKPHRF